MPRNTSDAECAQNKTDGELRNEVERYETREDRSAKLLIVSLFLVAVITWFFADDKNPYETWGIISATLAVGFAVVGEVSSAHRAKAPQAELDRRSNERVAASEERSAVLEKEVAKARERTAQLEQLTSWRTISNESRLEIVEKLKDSAASFDLLIEYERSDPESFMYANDIAQTFRLAGTRRLRIIGNSYLPGIVFGTHIASTLPINPIANAFISANVQMHIFLRNLETHLGREEVPPNLYVFVGVKPPVESRESSI